MKPTLLATTIGMLLIVLPGSACVWVSASSGGEKVRVLEPVEAASCHKLGRTTPQTADRVLIFARVHRNVREELRSLARNEAAELGGNGVVPSGPVEEGRQSFDIYRCEAR